MQVAFQELDVVLIVVVGEGLHVLLREEAEGVSEEWNNYQQNLLDLPLGQYVLRIYQTERNARVDWRGI